MRSVVLPARFEIRSLLGTGGGGRVYHARDRATEREVALKIVSPAESVRLRREFEILRHIRHENLVHVFTCSSLQTGEWYYTMEFVAGSDWGALMGQPQEPKEVQRMLVGVLRGLGHLHCHGEIHGDLKPGNILLGNDGTIKVADVGMGLEPAATSENLRTPGYTAPEVWTGGDSLERSDIYSVGVIAYEALTGRHPFGARTVREVISGQLEGWVPSPSVYGVDLPPQLERAIMRALERDPNLRQASADEFLEAIGDGDHAGEILAGRFVSRASELQVLTEFLNSDKPESPTLLHISGARGVGKSALLEQVLPRLIEAGWQIWDIRNPETDLAELTGEWAQQGEAREGQTSGIGGLVERLSARFGSEKVLLVEDAPESAGEVTRYVARYLWAEAIERGSPATLRVVRVVPASRATSEQFEVSLELSPFDSGQATELVIGILGAAEVDHTFAERLVAETGGIPDLIATTTLELIDRKCITRRFGRWRITEPSDAVWQSLKATTSRWARSWERLSEEDKDTLTAICMAGTAATTNNICTALPHVDLTNVISRLHASSWLLTHGEHLRLHSREAERVVLADDNEMRQGRLRSILLRKLEGILSRTDVTSLMIAGPPNPESVREGMWLGGHQRARGKYREAVATFLRVRGMARHLGDLGSAMEASLHAAEGLLPAGAYEDVIAILKDGSEWDGSTANGNARPERSRLLGLAYRAQGELEVARAHFSECSEEARVSGDLRLWLQAEAEIAEIMWRHSGELGRAAAVLRLREVLAEEGTLRHYPGELAVLKYQLGAALVVGGDRTEAISTLDEALQLSDSTYWRMRINNALATAHYYLGDFTPALRAADTAWDCAVQGEIDSFKPRILATRAGIRFGLGLFREAAEQNQLSALWGRRIGSPFEYAAGLLGATSDLIQLADYEKAILLAAEARRVASDVNQRDYLKAFEMEGVAYLQAGEVDAAGRLFGEARVALREMGSHARDLSARLSWHEARIAIERGEFIVAEQKLNDALVILEATRDWEDLPGVRIEVELLYARMDDSRLNVDGLMELVKDASSRGVALVQLRGTLALGEIDARREGQVPEIEDVLLRGLEVAERSGADEFIWRLSYLIARARRKAGDLRGASMRLSSAVRVIRDIASKLSARNRASYLNTNHARLLLAEAGTVTDLDHSRQKS